MITDTQKQIAATKAKLEALEKKAAAEASKKLTSLHKTVGYATRAELISALQGLEGGAKRGRKPGAAKKAAPKAAKAPKATKRAKRARITEELKAAVIEAVKSGEKGAAVAKKFGISIPSLQNIKKAAGLTKTRKK